MPLLLLGTLGCYVWARELAGLPAARVACWLYALSPSVLGWGPTALTDVAAAGVWIWTARAVLRFWQNPGRATAIQAGLWAGATNLVTFTGVLWLLALFAVGVVKLLLTAVTTQRVLYVRRAAGFFGAVAVAVAVINAGWLFDRTGFRLGELRARSSLLLGRPNPHGRLQENRFAATAFGGIRVPLPMPYLQGLDWYLHNWETGYPTYLLGRSLEQSPWYFLPVVLAFKLTPAELCLGASSIVAMIVGLFGARAARSRACALFLTLLPCLALSFLIASGKMGFYSQWLPGFPFLLLAGIFALAPLRRFGWIAAALVGAQALSALATLGHWHAYTNIFTAGRLPAAYVGPANLMPNRVTDYLYLARWVQDLESHPEVYIANSALIDLELTTRWKQTADWKDSSELWFVYDVANFIAGLDRREADVVAVIGGTLYVVRRRTQLVEKPVAAHSAQAPRR